MFSRIKFFCFFLQCIVMSLFGSGSLGGLQDQLDALYADESQVYNEVMARGRLIEDALNSSVEIMDKNLPAMENLFFQLTRQQEPALDLKRQVSLIAGYQEDVTGSFQQTQEQYLTLRTQIQDVCKQIERWGGATTADGKREELLGRAQLVFQTASSTIEKMKTSVAFVNKIVEKLSAYKNQVYGLFNTIQTLVRQANELTILEKEIARQRAKVKDELTVVAQKFKTLVILSAKEKKIVGEIKPELLSEEKLKQLERQSERVERHLEEAGALDRRLEDLFMHLSESVKLFDSNFQRFTEAATRITSPLENGLVASLEQAYRLVEAQKFEMGSVEQESQNEMTKLKACMLLVEREDDLVKVPNVIGLSSEEAAAALQKEGLTPDEQAGEPAPRREVSGRVYQQDPPPLEEIKPKGAVVYRVYGAYTPVIPDLNGMTLDEANTVLQKIGLKGNGKEGGAASDKTLEGKVFFQEPRAFTVGEDGSSVNFTYYSTSAAEVAEEVYSTTPFYVFCRLYVPKLRANSPQKSQLTIDDVDFVERQQPFVFSVEGKGLERYSKTFFELNKEIATFIQILGSEVDSGLISQFDGVLLLRVAHVYTHLEEIKKQVGDLIDFSGQDPLSYINLNQSNGLFGGVFSQGNVLLRWSGGPLVVGWSRHSKESSFSLFRQLIN